MTRRPHFPQGKKLSERDRIEQAIADDPLSAAEEIVDIMRALERIESLAHEDGSRIAHRALQSKLFTGNWA